MKSIQAIKFNFLLILQFPQGIIYCNCFLNDSPESKLCSGRLSLHTLRNGNGTQNNCLWPVFLYFSVITTVLYLFFMGEKLIIAFGITVIVDLKVLCT